MNQKISRLLLNGHKQREIADICGLSLSAVHARVRSIRGKERVRHPKRSNPSPIDPKIWDNAQWFEEHYKYKELSIGSIAYMTGRANGTVAKRLRKYGVEIRANIHKKTAPKPTCEWLTQHYVHLGWSLTKCAKEFGVSQCIMSDALIQFKIKQRDVGSQLKRKWKSHEATEYREKLRAASTRVWSDVRKRAEASIASSLRLANGIGHSKHIVYNNTRLRSKLELAAAKELDNLGLSWTYESTIMPYVHNNVSENMVVDFTITHNDKIILLECKNPYLIKKQKHKMMCLEKYCADNSIGLIVVIEPSDVGFIKNSLQSILHSFN